MLQAGFDIGGTSIKAGIVDDDHRILARRSVPFPLGEPYQNMVGIMAGLVHEMAGELSIPVSELQSIGIAVPGDIDAAGEMLLHAYNLQYEQVPLKAEMGRHFPDTRIYLANDANTAALAELHAGAFRGCRTAILITLGTGVGGGLILGGRMFNGGQNNGVELGHMVLDHNGSICTCGNRGCVETLCTATWLVQQGRKAIIEYPLSMIHTRAKGDLDQVTAKLVVDCAKEGDSIAKDIFERYIDHLSSAILSCIVLLDPEVIALGGGVSLSGDDFYEELRRLVQKKSFFHRPYRIVPAEMGNDAGVIGAAMLARNEP